jgi:hypothetical protein
MMKIEKIYPWNDEAERGLSLTFGRDRDQIIEGVNKRWLECYRLFDGAAYMVTRVEKGALTCCCYQGARLIDTTRWMRAQCQRYGLREIRFHTQRPALQRLLRREFPFQLDEYVFRLEVDQRAA